MKNLKLKYGQWAIVTGASSGIGIGFAEDLAARGFDLVLVARNDVALKDLANRLERSHSIDTRVVVLDLSEPSFIDDLADATVDLDIGLVVSNAGAAAMGALVTVPVDTLHHMLALNASSHLAIAHHFAARFIDRKRGGLLFVGSTAGLQGTPYAANYAGAKAYVHTMGQALNHELRKTDIDVTVLAPGPTKTPALTNRPDIDLSKMPAPVMSVDKLVTIGLKSLSKNKPFVVAGIPNRITDWMGRVLLGRRGARNIWGMMMEQQVPDRLRVTK